MRRSAAEQRALEKPLRDAMKKLDTQMSKLQKELAAIEQKLADPELYSRNGAEIGKLTQQQGELKKQLATAEEEWLMTAEKLEAMSG